MNSKLAIILSILIFALAALPWLLTGCQPGALLPAELREERAAYDATVGASQDATAEAIRQVKSTVVVEPVTTLPALADHQPDPAKNIQPLSEVSIFTMTPEGTPPPTASPTSIQPSPTATHEAAGLLATPVDDQTNILLKPATPIAMIDIQDILSEAMLSERLLQDTNGSDLTDVRVEITPEEITVTARVRLVAGIRQAVVAKGVFIVENASLGINISSITMAGRDVTRLYERKVEDRVTTSLYRLLPERFVESIIPKDGEVVVNSRRRP